MKRNKLLRTVALTMGATLSLSAFAAFSGCRPAKEALVLMSEELNELFSPFYSTAGSDMEIVGQTQLSMFTTDANGDRAFGEAEACVTLDHKTEIIGSEAEGNLQTEYYFVVKNGLKFSDGVPLTMNDVLFNLYVYLDPAFAGSSTMYSTDIVGLQAYRTQQNLSGSGSEAEEEITAQARTRAKLRLEELIYVYTEAGKTTTNGVYDADETKMKDALEAHTPRDGFKAAIGTEDNEEARTQLIADYKRTLELFKTELENDYKGSKDAYTDETTPYPTAPIYVAGKQVGTGFDEIISFMYTEGYVTVEYARDPVTNQYDRSKIEKATLEYDYNTIKTEEAAINKVYKDKVSTALDQILRYWGTGSQLQTEYTAKAKDVILHENLKEGELAYPNISGIVSLGHTTDQSEVTIGSKTYKIAHEHNDDGTPKNENEYDVLRITINKIDPKAIWNFGFTVAPYHYYSDPSQDDLKVDIKNNKFGVKWANFDFQQNVIQGKNKNGESKNRVPLGAGAYVATDRENKDTLEIAGTGFIENNIVYYKANKNFLLGEPKTEKLRYSVVNSSSAISALENGEVDFVTPQFTQKNGDYVKSEGFTKRGFAAVDSWQLGYGYIGVNAKYIPNIYLRRAIMAAMDTQLALEYYSAGQAVNVYWGMSAVNWAYPRTGSNKYDGNNPTKNMEDNNGHPYAMPFGNEKSTGKTDDQARIALIKDYMSLAGADENDPRIRNIKFTIAGASMTEHPAYLVFLKAVELLKACGWEVEIQADTNALTKLSTGSLAVWAAAWGSTLDPDMYQVWHKKSTATSVLSWGYDAILDESNDDYREERRIVNELAELIEDARSINDRDERTAIYKEALGKVLDLAVELPVYQRKTLYAFNVNTIKESSLAHDEKGNFLINPYTSPLNKIWEVELN